MTESSDILLVHKPKGITSFDVIRRLRKKLGIKKMGHAGTLDPLAEGLMIVGVGEGTKKLSKLIGLPKTYEVEIELGIRTETGDKEGKIIEEKTVQNISEKEIDKVLKACVGTLELPVPAFSAVKQKGVPLYKKARRGMEVSPPVRPMRIYAARLLGIRQEDARQFLSVRMEVGSGVYIRSVAEEIGRRLDVPATVSKLIRTKIGEYKLENAEILE